MKIAAAFTAIGLLLAAPLSADEGDIPAADETSLPVREVPPRELDETFTAAEPMAKRGQTLPLAPARSIAIDVREGTWLSPDISPDGRTIIFDLLGDLYRINARGGEAKPIATGMAFEAQPVFSPDGHSIVYISDRSGAENIWIARSDGSQPRQVTLYDGNSVFTSPAWSRDGKVIFVSRYRADRAAFELWRFDAATGAGELLSPIKPEPNSPRDSWQSSVGVVPSPDGRFIYFARHVGDPVSDTLPEWTIVRRDLASGEEETLISAPRSPRPDLVLGTAFRPAISADGKLLAYGVRDRGQTGLRLFDLETRESRWLAYPIQHDELQATAWRDLLPHHAFTPDGKALIANAGGKLLRIDIASGKQSVIPFHVDAQIGIGPETRQRIVEETGPVKARLIQDPVPSPDGGQLAFSTLGSIYVMPLVEGGGAAPDRRRVSTELVGERPETAVRSVDGEAVPGRSGPPT